MRLKEKIIVALIIFSTILLAMIPVIKGSSIDSEENESSAIIKITIVGEINAPTEKGDICNKIIIDVPMGSSYGFIITRIKLYLTKYSIIDSDMKKRYFMDSEIKINSSNTSINTNVSTKGKICINKASLKELMMIEGIKESRAKKIISYRKNKRIESYTELARILGLSDDAIENIKRQAFL